MSQNEPPRMIDDPASSDAARELLRGAVEDGPSPEALARMAANVKAASAGAAGSSASSGLWFTKAKMWLAVAAIGVGSVLAAKWLRTEATADPVTAPEPRPFAHTTIDSGARAAAELARDASVAQFTGDTTDAGQSEDASVVVRRPCVESEHVDRVVSAQQALARGAFSRVLSATREDQQRCGRRGSMVEERERIAIQALWQSGDRAGARSRWRAFSAQFPNSPYGLRLRALIEDSSATP